MWWNKREAGVDGEDGPSEEGLDEFHRDSANAGHHRTSSVPSKKSRLGGTSRQTFVGSKSLTGKRSTKKRSKSAHNLLSGEGANEDEGNTGFEVSLENLLPPESPLRKSSPNGTPKKIPLPPTTQSNSNIPVRSTDAVVSFETEASLRQKVTRNQYSVHQWPALSAKKHTQTVMPSVMLKPNKYHRVSFTPVTNRESGTTFDDVLFLLRSHEVVDEMTSIKQEMKRMDLELQALQSDRQKLEEMAETLAAPEPSEPSLLDESNSGTMPQEWDPNALLAAPRGTATTSSAAATAQQIQNDVATTNTITPEQRSLLETWRGASLTVFFHDKSVTETLANKCGVKNHVLAKFKESPRNNILELSPDTCREGGAATTISHLALLCKESGGEIGFFLGRDQGKSMFAGHLPDRLYRRMQDTGMNPKTTASEIAYLSVGPLDYYYAEFKSGEVWWGSATDDRAFTTLCQEWDIYRVVFGPPLVLDDYEQNSQTILPWVIISRDGRAAWKNLPARLDNLLSSRMANQAGIAEVSLGSGDSYFCRFLDGSIDYCLPAAQAQIVAELESRGHSITSVTLHPELSQDFIIRSANY